MNDKISKTQNNKYDLEERTAIFAEDIIDICTKTTKNIITNPIIDQLVRSGTSIGANYCEANGSSSKKDFKNRILGKTYGEVKEDSKKLWQEAQELTLIFSKIASNTK